MHAKNNDISKWLADCRKDRRGGQRELYRHFYGYSMSICLRYAKNREEASEILNNAWLKIFAKIKQYDPDYPFKPWCRRILINAAIDYHRRIKHLPLFTDIDDISEAAHPEFSLPALSQHEDMLPVLQLLPTVYRTVFNLAVFEEYKHHEIAELLGISIGASKSNLSKAKSKLRKILTENRKIKSS